MHMHHPGSSTSEWQLKLRMLERLVLQSDQQTSSQLFSNHLSPFALCVSSTSSSPLVPSIALAKLGSNHQLKDPCTGHRVRHHQVLRKHRYAS